MFLTFLSLEAIGEKRKDDRISRIGLEFVNFEHIKHKMSFNRSRSELFYLSGLKPILSKFL